MHPAKIQEDLHIDAQGLAEKFITYAVGGSEFVAQIGESEFKTLHAATTTFIFKKLKDQLLKDTSISIETPITGVLPVSKDNIEVVSFIRDNVIGNAAIPDAVKSATRSAREQALKARGDLRDALAGEIAEVMKKRHVSGKNAADYQKRYDENKFLLELLGLSPFQLQELKENYAKLHGGATVTNGKDFANLVDNAVFHIREGKIDIESLQKIGLNEIGLNAGKIQQMGEKLSEMLEAIKTNSPQSNILGGIATLGKIQLNPGREFVA